MKALVTGSTQGIGYAIAKALVKEGFEVTVHCARDMEKAERIRDEIGAASAVVCDLSKMDEVDALHAKTGDVDVLVLNASVQYRNPYDKITDEEFDTQVNVNFKSTFKLIRAYSEKMKENGFGRIITVGSVQQYKPHKDMAIYAATKCAVVSLVNNLAKQLAPFGVTVNNVAPGVIATPRNEAALSDPEYRQKVLDGIPAGYAGEASDMAGTVVLLTGEGGRYITGADIVVDGGMHL
ncbi:MAG: SDR family oxidoreductase [Clostridia bacterium]|nr:SDR family oxidoreductase [Clostridia bacterium]